MQGARVAAFLVFCAAPGAWAVGARSDASLNPVTRVVELLQGLSKKIYAEGKAEEDLYEKFVCWGESVINSKTASNAAAQSRIDELEAYIADIKAGKIEFTSERVDLENEIKHLTADIESSKSMREKEHADYVAAKDEMQKAIAALEKAIQVLKEATSFTQSESLLTLRQHLSEGFKQREADSAALDQAIRIGKEFLPKADALFLERLFTGEWGHEVPTVDWKKLNRKAVFKMKYKARSFKIQDILAKLLQTFESNLAEADEKEKKAVEVYEKLMASLTGQLKKAQDALQEMAAEGAARGLSLDEAQEEVDALKTQIKNDLKFIEQTQTSLDEMKASWKARKALRAGELEAISKAIAILHSDDARDLMKKSFKSQGYLLLQEGLSARSAGAVIRTAAVKSGDHRLLALAKVTATLQVGGHFDKVIEAIDKMIATLKAEGEQDLVIKEDCEKKRANQTRTAVLAARNIDEITDSISKLVAEIKEILAEIEEKEKAKAALIAEAEEATKIREAEHLEWMASDKDDKAAAKLVEMAKDVLANFYKDNNLVFVQKRVVPVEAGKAPPPPPEVWTTSYSEGTEEGQNIVAVLEMIQEDILKDIEKALAEEEEAEKEYQVFMEETKKAIAELEAAIVELKATSAEKANEVAEEKKTRAAAKESLDAVMQTIKDIAMECDYYQVNFVGRSKNRDIEIDGLSKAKAILEGAAFAPPSTDATRELKPGDALLLQRRA